MSGEEGGKKKIVDDFVDDDDFFKHTFPPSFQIAKKRKSPISL